MIREWHISRFKSIAGTEVLPCKPLTILAGPNSSGKSSVIQSVLLIAQSLASQVPDRQLVLNGELVRLGTFEDVRNQQADEPTIDFGFVVDLDFTGTGLIGGGQVRGPYGTSLLRSVGTDIAALTVSGDLTFGPAGDIGSDTGVRPLQGDVVRASFRTTVRGAQVALVLNDEEQSNEPDVLIERRTETQLDQLVGTIQPTGPAEDLSGLRKLLRYSVQLSPRVSALLRRGRLDLPLQDSVDEVVGARLQHFLPATVVWRRRALRQIVSSLTRRLLSIPSTTVDATLNLWRVANDPVRAALATVIVEAAGTSGETTSRYIRGLRAARAEPDQLKALLDRIGEIVGEPWLSAMSAVEGPLPEEHLMAFQGLHVFFGSIRYLGPLRDDPKPLYAMSGAVDPTDVGSKGQYTAAVLDVNAHRDIDFIAPGQSVVTRARLGEALRLWLQHFGMADAIRTADEPKLGHRLLVRPTGIRSYVDLTNVGVGVSQVLPILVMALVSDPRSVLLFEQPELHLHPAVQSQLGDFFIALARSGRQCIVETHSEYLLNRLRLRIAESESGSGLSDLAIVHFVERPGAQSQFTPVVINEFGAIPEWPKGFFDQGPDESELILRAAMKKKAAKGSRADLSS